MGFTVYDDIGDCSMQSKSRELAELMYLFILSAYGIDLRTHLLCEGNDEVQKASLSDEFLPLINCF